MTRISTLLVANRGEIARRIIRTARARGIRTVAVYSEPDARSPHVLDADAAVGIGGAAGAQSYLDGARILDAARRSGADALHPGYGFLAENAEFAEACARSGVVFVGPAPESMREMGLKDRAKEIARKAGVPVLPDARLVGDDPAEWRAESEVLGLPLLVKAVAGGGGTGMRLVRTVDQLVDAVDGARREAGNSFGNSTVFLERYLDTARHIEIQVFGDAHGNAIHLGERECSVQRRHQKVLEEAPSSVVDPQLRERMGATSVSLVRELGYLGAGTVEYLLDDRTGEFYFLEMNTRLQVEHPVTEEVTGLDLVALQLRVGEGDAIGIEQADVVPRGHAIEVRLYAEDPARDFLPTPGTLLRYTHSARPGLRFEDGVAATGEIPPFYDPMIAKIIAHGDTRTDAAGRLAAALDATQIHGIATNRDFLAALLRDPGFLSGQTCTDFLDHRPHLLDPPPATLAVVHLAAAIAVSVARRRADGQIGGHAPPGFRPLVADLLTTAEWSRIGGGGEYCQVRYRLASRQGDTDLVVEIDGTRHEYPLRDLGPDSVRVHHGGVDIPCAVATHPDGTVWVNDPGAQTGWRPHARLPESGTRGASDAGPVNAMPGTVVAVQVVAGQHVSAGQTLVVVEAMKMEHPAVAATDGVVDGVHVEVGQFVPANTLLVAMAAIDGAA